MIGIRRTAPGKSELHANFTDVWYAIDGAATLVTGGIMQGAWGALKDATGDYRAGLFLLFAMAVALSALLYWLCGQLRRARLLVLPAVAAA